MAEESSQESVAGQAGTYEVVFKNGSTVVLRNAILEFKDVHAGNKKVKKPSFHENVRPTPYRRSWDSAGNHLDPNSIEAIFMLEKT